MVVHQRACLLDVIAPLVPQVQVLQRDLDDPRELGLAARDWLIGHPAPADFNLYLEDDLVIQDPLFVEKILWMAERTNHKCVLLPHRYELTRRLDLPPRLLIDGAIDHNEIKAWHRPAAGVATGEFRGQQGLQFDCPSNPHAGCFGISRPQLLLLRERELPTDGFVGPLETAATYTVGCAFLLLKPALVNRRFLMIEHGHPSWLSEPRAFMSTATAFESPTRFLACRLWSKYKDRTPFASQNWQEIRLDIDPGVQPDVIGTMTIKLWLMLLWMLSFHLIILSIYIPMKFRLL